MQSRTMPSLLLLCLAALGAIDAAENQTEYCAAGWELSIALDDYPPYTINEGGGEIRGISTDLIAALAKEIGFTFTIEAMGGPTPGESWTDFLRLSLPSHDLMGSWFFQETSRMDYTQFSVAYVDASPVLLELLPELPAPLLADQMWLLFEPFDGYLWGAILFVATMMAVGIYYLERSGPDFKDFDHLGPVHAIPHSVYLALASFSKLANYDPKTNLGKAVTMIFSFALVIIVSNHTAWLAARLAVRPPLSPLQDIHLLGLSGSRLCIEEGPMVEFMQRRFPEFSAAQLLIVPPQKNVNQVNFTASLISGECKAVVTSTTIATQMKTGSNCSMTIVGQPLGQRLGSFVFRKVTDEMSEAERWRADCIRESIDLALVKAHSSNLINELQAQYLEQESGSCEQHNLQRQQSEVWQPLTPQHFLGPVVVLIAAQVVAILVRTCQRRKKKAKKVKKRKQNAAVDKPGEALEDKPANRLQRIKLQKQQAMAEQMEREEAKESEGPEQLYNGRYLYKLDCLLKASQAIQLVESTADEAAPAPALATAPATAPVKKGKKGKKLALLQS